MNSVVNSVRSVFTFFIEKMVSKYDQNEICLKSDDNFEPQNGQSGHVASSSLPKMSMLPPIPPLLKI
jgi:hypothetical protein